MPKDVTEAEFLKVMSQCGTVISHKMKNIESKGEPKALLHKMGYVCYKDVREAQKCIQMHDNSNAFGFGTKPLRVDFWQSKVDQKSEIEEKSVNQMKKFIHFIQ